MTDAGPIETLIADFVTHSKRLGRTPPQEVADVVRELQNNVYPSMIALAEQINEVDEVIQEVVDQQDSYLQPEFAAQILNTVALALTLANAVDELELDDLMKKRLTDITAALKDSAEQTAAEVANAAIDDGPDDPDGEAEPVAS